MEDPTPTSPATPPKTKLPPYPQPFKPYTDAEERYTGPPADMKKRILFKMYSAWILFGKLADSERVASLLKEIPEDFTSDEYAAKGLLVDILDRLSKILGDTNLIEELNFLCDENPI